MNINIPIELVWGLCGYIVVTTGGFIWWAATTTEQIKSIKETIVVLCTNVASFVKKEDVDREIGKIQKDVDAAHRRIDEIQLKG